MHRNSEARSSRCGDSRSLLGLPVSSWRGRPTGGVWTFLQLDNGGELNWMRFYVGRDRSEAMGFGEAENWGRWILIKIRRGFGLCEW